MGRRFAKRPRLDYPGWIGAGVRRVSAGVSGASPGRRWTGAGAGSHGHRSRFRNGMLKMAVAGLPDSRKVDLRFGNAARQMQYIGATVRTADQALAGAAPKAG